MTTARKPTPKKRQPAIDPSEALARALVAAAAGTSNARVRLWLTALATSNKTTSPSTSR